MDGGGDGGGYEAVGLNPRSQRERIEEAVTPEREGDCGRIIA